MSYADFFKRATRTREQPGGVKLRERETMSAETDRP
jgi:hypothetical protein